MDENQSAEYRALVKASPEIISEIAPELVIIADKLFAMGLIYLASVERVKLGGQIDRVKASDLVHEILEKVKAFPEVFEEFLTVLNEITSLQRLVKWIKEDFQTMKLEDEERGMVSPDMVIEKSET